MRARGMSWIAVVAVALCAAPVFAANMDAMGMMGGGTHQRMFTFGIGGGVALPVSDAKDALKNGWNGLGYARVRLPGFPVSLGVNVSFQRFDMKDAAVSTGTGGLATSGTSSMLGGLGDVKFDLMQGLPIHPYITAGVGAYNLKTDVSGAEGETSKTHFGINGGAGIALHFGAIAGFIQGRVDNVYTDTGGVIDTKSIQVIPVTAGIEF
ncbi:MAG TPA: outer membrane beta-barrel protein [Candidatus Eisenbacteria bacterium]|nr:outer membrane beta-barrel protein [Candidatus Eisenbacteria bacterium]